MYLRSSSLTTGGLLMDLVLHTDASYRNDLDTSKFARMLDDPSQCYKFYWLEAILNLMPTEEGDISFEKIIDEMICDAWYSVTRYKLHLGPTIRGKCENALERAINVINRDDQMSYASSKDEIMHGIELHQAEIRADKLTLTINVPYRLLSSFLDEIGGSNKMWYKSGEMIRYISLLNQDTALPYIIIDGKGLDKKIRIHPEWRRLIIDNYPIIKGWIQMKKVRFLQDRNPGVPGIIYKLAPENENGRKLSNAKALWKEVAEVLATPIHDIYSGHEIDVRKSDLDHFVPWSFVANDELWDLIPMERRLNSSKSNRLPEWDLYFGNMAALQYKMYETVFSHEQIQKAFEKCRRDNLNAMWAVENLYIPGNTEEQFTNILEHNLRPVCVVAPRTGAAAGRGVLSIDACTRSGWRALRVLEIRRNGAHRNVERPPVLRHDRAEGRSIDSDGRRRKYRSVLDLRGRAHGPAKPEVAECDLSEGI